MGPHLLYSWKKIQATQNVNEFGGIFYYHCCDDSAIVPTGLNFHQVLYTCMLTTGKGGGGGGGGQKRAGLVAMHNIPRMI